MDDMILSIDPETLDITTFRVKFPPAIERAGEALLTGKIGMRDYAAIFDKFAHRIEFIQINSNDDEHDEEVDEFIDFLDNYGGTD